jgi:hypothetical protein
MELEEWQRLAHKSMQDAQAGKLAVDIRRCVLTTISSVKQLAMS